jgi:neutral ceramidase
MDNQLMAGVSRVNITPEVGGYLYGYNPNTISKSVNDDLTATAIALEYGSTRVLLISITVCQINTELSNAIRKQIGSVLDIPADNVILSATHTHSGPRTNGMPGWGDIDKEYCDRIFIPRILNAAKEAVNNLRPAKLGIGTTESFVGVNRRQYGADGVTRLGQNPWGYFDKTMTVLSFKGVDNKPIANIVHYGAHCTAAGNNTEITRDWPGVMIDRLEKESGAITAFLNGAEGDVAPRITNGGSTGNIHYAMELGGVAAQDALRAYKAIKEYANVSMDCVTDLIKLPYGPRIPLEEAEEKIKALENTKINTGGLLYNYYSQVIASYQKGEAQKTHMELPQTIVRLGQVVFIPFMFEMFSEISIRLREYSPYAHTLCLSNTNGSIGYLPSQDQICRGGYEVVVFRHQGVQPLTDDADNYIINENLRILNKIPYTQQIMKI